MSSRQPAEQSHIPFWALLIGIDVYRNIRNLSGCVNDVQAMRVFLMNRYLVPEEQIRVLTNEDATRANILKEFLEFLVMNPRIKPGDQILFHYCGHGSQMTDPSGVEPDGLNETLVPHDSRTPGVYDIPDKTLAVLLDKLASNKGSNITVILDSCHSGSGTRRVEDSDMSRVRRVPVDDRVPPIDLDADLLTDATVRGAGPSGWAFSGIPYVLLAACRDREESNEHRGKFTDNTEVMYGALTFFTLQIMQEISEGKFYSYAELHERVAARVNFNYPNQMPQCEGQRERQVFGTLQVQRDPFIPVQQVRGDQVTLRAGLVHGLRPDTELALYPFEVRTRTDAARQSNPLAQVKVVSVSATTAEARLPGFPHTPIPPNARALITKQVYSGLSQSVCLEAADDDESKHAIAALRSAIEPTTPNKYPSPYLRLVDDDPFDLRVRAEGGLFSIYNATNELLVMPQDIRRRQNSVYSDQPDRNSVETVRRALENIVRFRTIANLSNDDPRSELVGKVRLRLRQYIVGTNGPQARDFAPEATDAGNEITIYFDADHKERNLYVVDVINESSRPVYASIFTLSQDYSIRRLHPSWGGQEEIRPNNAAQPFPIGLHRGTTQLRFWLDKEWDFSRDYLKAIITTVPSDLQILVQDGLDVPPIIRKGDTRGQGSTIVQLLSAIASGVDIRMSGPNDSWTDEDWTVVEMGVNVVRLHHTITLDASSNRVSLGDGFTLEKPTDFTGQVTVSSWGQNTRGLDGDYGVKPPAGLKEFTAPFQPVTRAGTRSTGIDAALVLTLDVDDASRKLVTVDSPLHLELDNVDSQEVTDLLPLAFDGEDYLLVGHTGDTPRVVKIVELPPQVQGEAGASGRRGTGHTLRLFIYKKIGRYTPLIGLHRIEYEDGKIVSGNVAPDQFHPGQSVAILLHGFNSDSRWMVKKLAQFLHEEVHPYDHILTWDYESFGTNIQENGEQLALALRLQGGFGLDDQLSVHVYAHGMGSLVARCMIELSNGHEFVDRLVMAGPPNRGTTLATVTRGFLYLTTVLINQFSLIPPLAAINWLLKQGYEQGLGPADLVVDSALAKRLNGLTNPSHVPYLVLAGQNVSDTDDRTLATRLARKVLNKSLDAIFGEPNDAVIGMSSMQGVRGGSYPALQVNLLSCDHSHYFESIEGREVIKR
jgi:pimeloyl-ACP methyl ester carboxylesterase